MCILSQLLDRNMMGNYGQLKSQVPLTPIDPLTLAGLLSASANL